MGKGEFSQLQKRKRVWVSCAWDHWAEQKCLKIAPGTHIFSAFCRCHRGWPFWIIPFALSRLTALICIPFAPPRHRCPRRLPSLPCCVWRCLWSMPTLWHKEKVSGAEIRPQCVNQSLLKVMRVLKRTITLSFNIEMAKYRCQIVEEMYDYY